MSIRLGDVITARDAFQLFRVGKLKDAELPADDTSLAHFTRLGDDDRFAASRINFDGPAVAYQRQVVFVNDLPVEADMKFSVAGISGPPVGELNGEKPGAVQCDLFIDACCIEFALFEVGAETG